MIKKTFTFIILFFSFCFMLLNPNILTKSIFYSISLFINYIFPSLFPFFIINDIFINYNYTYYIGKILKKPLHFLFNIGEEESFVFVMSLISGQPSNAKYIKELLDKKIINVSNAILLTSYTIFPSPMFVISTVGLMFYNNINIGIILIISIYLSNIIYGIILRNKYRYNKQYIKKNNPLNLGKLINKSILSSFNTLLIILGSIIIFVIIVNTIDTLLNNDIINAFTSSILEITIGTKNITSLNIDLNTKILLSSFILSFGGLSVHLQIKSILCDYNIKYSKILFNKIIISIISLIICNILISVIQIQ